MIDPSLEAAGYQCGINVESLYKKYSRCAPSNQSTSAKRITSTKSNGQYINDKTNMLSNYDTSDTNAAQITDMSGLDRIRICKQCNGYGLVKERYNHQVKEINCDECNGEGTIETKTEKS